MTSFICAAHVCGPCAEGRFIRGAGQSKCPWHGKFFGIVASVGFLTEIAIRRVFVLDAAVRASRVMFEFNDRR
jgi:hypothetical protein